MLFVEASDEEPFVSPLEFLQAFFCGHRRDRSDKRPVKGSLEELPSAGFESPLKRSRDSLGARCKTVSRLVFVLA